MSALQLADAKAHLNITVATYDAELQTVIDAAEDWIGQIVGPVTATAGLVKTYDGDCMAVLLPSGVASVQSVTENGQAITDYTVNLASGIVYAGSQLAPRRFFPGVQNIVVSYTGYLAGYSSLPAGLLFAIKEKVRELWSTQRGSGTRRPGSGSTNAAGQPLPDFDDLLAPYLQIPGFA